MRKRKVLRFTSFLNSSTALEYSDTAFLHWDTETCIPSFQKASQRSKDAVLNSWYIQLPKKTATYKVSKKIRLDALILQ